MIRPNGRWLRQLIVLGGDYLEGPAPRGLDRFAVIVTNDGSVEVDVSKLQMGAPHG